MNRKKIYDGRKQFLLNQYPPNSFLLFGFTFGIIFGVTAYVFFSENNALDLMKEWQTLISSIFVSFLSGVFLLYPIYVSRRDKEVENTIRSSVIAYCSIPELMASLSDIEKHMKELDSENINLGRSLSAGRESDREERQYRILVNMKESVTKISLSLDIIRGRISEILNERKMIDQEITIAMAISSRYARKMDEYVKELSSSFNNVMDTLESNKFTNGKDDKGTTTQNRNLFISLLVAITDDFRDFDCQEAKKLEELLSSINQSAQQVVEYNSKLK